MTDRFYKDIELPDVSVSPSAPDSGFIQVYGKGGKLAYQNATGAETILERVVTPQISIDGGNAATVPTQVALRIDFGLSA